MPISPDTVREAPVGAERLLRVLRAHACVGQAAVTSWTDAEGMPQLAAYVVPAEALGMPAVTTRLEDELLQRWEHLWSMLYEQGDAPQPEFDIRGWNSSYTRTLLPEEQMRDYVDQTVRSIREIGPRTVLEVGCGSGLLLHRIAPGCERYVATDFSAAAVDRLGRQVEERSLGHIVELRHAPAHDLGSLPGAFDAVVLNSVVQYFPTPGYLADVLERAVAHTRDGGTVFMGDVYSLALREALHTSVVVHQASPSTPRELLRTRVLHRIAHQTELLVDPGFFVDLAARSPRITAVEARPKYGRYRNEMTSFRYDVLLEVGGCGRSQIDVPWHDWEREHLDAEALHRMVQGHPRTGVAVSRIPNARALEWVRRWAAINDPQPGDEATGVATTAGLTADDLRDLPGRAARAAWVSCLSAHPDGALDAVWLPRGLSPQPAVALPAQPAGRHTNNPLWPRTTEWLTRQVRDHLRRELGQRATAVTLVCVEALPALSGKPGRQRSPAVEGEASP